MNRERGREEERRRRVLTKGTVAEIPLQPTLAGPTIETGVALTVVDSGVTHFPCDEGTKAISRSDYSGNWERQAGVVGNEVMNQC